MDSSRPLYLLTEEDIFRIDGLIACLNLAVTEIINNRQLTYPGNQSTPEQDRFWAEFYQIIDGKSLGQ